MVKGNGDSEGQYKKPWQGPQMEIGRVYALRLTLLLSLITATLIN